jgi:hypothetical protein
MANEKGGVDNITVVIVHVPVGATRPEARSASGAKPPAPKGSEEKTDSGVKPPGDAKSGSR